eukprot:UN13207
MVKSDPDAQCKPFHTLYVSGKEICERMWSGSFTYTENADEAYTMWFNGSTNPNDQITLNRGLNTTSTCLLKYYHKDFVTSETTIFSQTPCYPWKDANCCYYDTVKDIDTLLRDYEDIGYRWDRCGPLSEKCEQFFIQENCFYECDANVGLFKMQNGSWKIESMPIRSDYCDKWFDACYDDLFCADDTGSFFSCPVFPDETGSSTKNDDDM